MFAFGSRCRGDNEPDSDLDVLVIVDQKNREIRNRISHCAWKLGFDTGIVIQSVVMTRKQVEIGPEKSSLLILAVQQEGERI